MSDYQDAAVKARRAIYAADPQPDRETLVVLCKEARDLAPDDEHTRQWDRFLVALRPGHRLKVATSPAVVATGNDIGHAELIRDIEEIFHE